MDAPRGHDRSSELYTNLSKMGKRFRNLPVTPLRHDREFPNQADNERRKASRERTWIGLAATMIDAIAPDYVLVIL